MSESDKKKGLKQAIANNQVAEANAWIAAGVEVGKEELKEAAKNNNQYMAAALAFHAQAQDKEALQGAANNAVAAIIENSGPQHSKLQSDAMMSEEQNPQHSVYRRAESDIDKASGKKLSWVEKVKLKDEQEKKAKQEKEEKEKEEKEKGSEEKSKDEGSKPQFSTMITKIASNESGFSR